MSPLAWTGTRLCRQRGGVVGSWNREEPPSRFFFVSGAWQPVYVEVGELPVGELLAAYYDKAQGVAELAALAGMSLSVFKRRFAEHFNDSVYHWMMRQKALKIFSDIRDGEDSTKALMNKYGFRHYTQFSRFCKNYLQATPAQLIASIKEG